MTDYYHAEHECFDEAVLQLLDQFKERNPTLKRIKLEYGDGEVATFVFGKPPKRHALQKGPTVTEWERSKP